MIVSFAHKGLRVFYETGSKRGIQPVHADKLRRILVSLEAATTHRDLDLPGYRLHKLVGDRDGFWSIRISGNWRIIFRFVVQDVELVDYLDYH